MRNYEIMFIVNPNVSDEEIDKINAQIEGIVTAGGGQIQKIEKMGKRRLAYEVDRHREGSYVLFAIAANGEIVRECERRLRVLEPVIKYLTVRLDDEIRRFDKLRGYRQKRAERRGAAGKGSSQSAEQSADDMM